MFTLSLEALCARVFVIIGLSAFSGTACGDAISQDPIDITVRCGPAAVPFPAVPAAGTFVALPANPCSAPIPPPAGPAGAQGNLKVGGNGRAFEADLKATNIRGSAPWPVEFDSQWTFGTPVDTPATAFATFDAIFYPFGNPPGPGAAGAPAFVSGGITGTLLAFINGDMSANGIIGQGPIGTFSSAISPSAGKFFSFSSRKIEVPKCPGGPPCAADIHELDIVLKFNAPTIDFPGVNPAQANGTFAVVDILHSGFLEVDAVPEPNTLLLSGIALLVVLYRSMRLASRKYS
jgi:hypothetical protein